VTAAKPRLGFFSFASCEGCQLAVLECERELPALFGLVEIVRFREAASYEGREIEPALDVAFVEGSITRDEDADEVREIRRRAKVLVALGACAATAGLNALKNARPLARVRDEVYGDAASWYPTVPARPVSAVVPVDHTLRGCPIDRVEFLRLVTFLLRDLPMPVPKRPVCAECKAAGVVCVLLARRPCLGPVTTCGCRAICTRYGAGCEGCRGLLADANLDGLRYAWRRIGLGDADVEHHLRLFNNYAVQAGRMEIAP
jgi:coenzyme F420-reducing hydrogenase gamma subunit